MLSEPGSEAAYYSSASGQARSLITLLQWAARMTHPNPIRDLDQRNGPHLQLQGRFEMFFQSLVSVSQMAIFWKHHSLLGRDKISHCCLRYLTLLSYISYLWIVDYCTVVSNSFSYWHNRLHISSSTNEMNGLLDFASVLFHSLFNSFCNLNISTGVWSMSSSSTAWLNGPKLFTIK